MVGATGIALGFFADKSAMFLLHRSVIVVLEWMMERLTAGERATSSSENTCTRQLQVQETVSTISSNLIFVMIDKN